MLLSRALGAIGRFCIGLGVLTLLFVAYQLWGTGILTAQAQNSLENDFEDLLEQVVDVDEAALELVAEPDEPAVEEPAEDPADGDDGGDDDSEAPEPEPTVDPVELERAQRELELLADLVWQPAGEPVAKLVIPDIGVDWTIVEGVGTDELRNGPGHYPGTPMPGMAGNSGIAGHRTTWGAPFNRIDELEPGDEITVQTIQGTFTYRVIAQESGKGHFIVSPDRVDVLDQDFADSPNRLTLTACHPKFSARQRIIVVAELVGEPAITVPRPDSLGEVEVDLASEDFGDETAGETETAGDDGGLPGDPDLDDGQPEDPDASEEPVEDDATDEPTDADEDDDEDAAAATEAEQQPQAQPVAFQGTDEADSFGQGLNGDRGAILPAIMWGFAAAAIIGATGFVARRWRRWPSYVMAVAPFAIVLFVCFVHIDQALPSY
ncbi:MAG: class E sortase [Actinomycetota bacterium]